MTVTDTRLDRKMLINGEWVDGEKRTDIIHPYDGDVVGSVPLAGERQVVEAIDGAEAAFQASDLSAYQRYELLSETARQLEERAEDVAHILTTAHRGARRGRPGGSDARPLGRAGEANVRRVRSDGCAEGFRPRPLFHPA